MSGRSPDESVVTDRFLDFLARTAGEEADEMEFDFDEPRWYEGGWLHPSGDDVALWIAADESLVRVYDIEGRRAESASELLFETTLASDSLRQSDPELSVRLDSIESIDDVDEATFESVEDGSLVLTVF